MSDVGIMLIAICSFLLGYKIAKTGSSFVLMKQQPDCDRCPDRVSRELLSPDE